MEDHPFIDWWFLQWGNIFFSIFLFNASLILSIYRWYSTGTFLTLGFFSAVPLYIKDPILGPGEAFPVPNVAVADIIKIIS